MFLSGAARANDGTPQIRTYARPSVIFEFCYENRTLLPYYAGEGRVVPRDNPGINIVALRRLDELIDEVTISYQRQPWKSCLSGIASGEISGVIASYYKVRESIGVYPKASGELDAGRKFGSANYCLYKWPDSMLDYNGEYFSGIGFSPVAVPTGYSVINKLKNEKLMYFEVGSSRQGFELLSHRRVAGVVTLCEVGKRLIAANTQSFGSFIQDQPELVKRSAYLMVSKPFYRDNTALVEKMWDLLKIINTP